MRSKQNPVIDTAVEQFSTLCRPDRIHWCDGSDAEALALSEMMLEDGSLIPLAWKGCHLHRSHPNDVARVESKTFVCSHSADDAGPTNRWWNPVEAHRTLREAFEGCMQGRTLYVVPYLLGPEGSPSARVGVELTDSPYVVLSMRAMTRVGKAALETLRPDETPVLGFHSTGQLDPERRWICHFPETREIWSFGSNYGGDALLGKKCFALRIASAIGRDEGWLAEHMLLIEVVDPSGESHFLAAAFPSACGKTNLAMLQSPVPGWTVRMLGDDIAWLRVGDDGRLWAVNPENGLFGVVPGTSPATNPVADAMIRRNTIFTNVAVTDAGEPWWEGCGRDPGDYLTDWQGRRRPSTDVSEPFAHPNARFTVPLDRCPNLSSHANDPQGVPISAIVFGGRRKDTMPLAMQAFDWSHGVFLGASMASQTTAAAEGTIGAVRRDPMAMLPFCGYHIGDYLSHWLEIGNRLRTPPPVFHVNWFRKDGDGNYVWPGFQTNIHVLQWIVERSGHQASAVSTVAGLIPDTSALTASGVEDAAICSALAVDPSEWQAEWESIGLEMARWGPKVPLSLTQQWEALGRRLRPTSVQVA